MHHLKTLAVTSFHFSPQSFRILYLRMSSNVSNESPLSPPASVYGMKNLERQKFTKTVEVPCVSVSQENLGHCLPALKKYLLKMNKLNPVQPSDKGTWKKILLDPSKIDNIVNDSHIENFKKSGLLVDGPGGCSIELTYDNWTVDEILKAVLPSDKESLSSFSIIGHIYHVNLRDHLLEFKDLIGKVLLDKNKLARTVVNKINSIDSTYRTFQIELLAGEDDMMATVRENHCSYQFDFSKVYWNPRLGGEHERIVNQLNSNDILYDVFAGVGPFSIPAAKKGCSVMANDLNPESFKWLQHNIKSNKVAHKVRPFNKDGAEFICQDIKEDLLKRWTDDSFQGNCHITMNLPALAVDFLHNFRGLFPVESRTSHFKSPIVHVYCFIKGENDPAVCAKKLVESKIGFELDGNLKAVFPVRTVSNKKEMMRISFSLSEDILFANKNDDQEPLAKRPCLS